MTSKNLQSLYFCQMRLATHIFTILSTRIITQGKEQSPCRKVHNGIIVGNLWVPYLIK